VFWSWAAGKAWLGAFRFLLPAMVLHPFNVAAFPAFIPFIASCFEIFYGVKSLHFQILSGKTYYLTQDTNTFSNSIWPTERSKELRCPKSM
jgi:hypothetical protein